VTAADALRVAAAFGLAIDGARAVALPGSTNRAWRLESATATYVVRRYGRLHVSETAVAFEHAVLDHAARRVAEVRAPLRDPAGASYRLDDGAFVAVFPWVHGTTGRRDLGMACAVAEVLARFHRAVRDLHVRGGTRSGRFLGTLPWLVETFKGWAGGSPLARRLPWDELIVALGAAIARVAPLAPELPIVVVHGDPHPDNVVVAESAVRGLLDFDFAHETERVYDVGALLDEFARDDDDGPLRLERIAPLVAAYAAAAPLSAPERAALPDAMLRHAALLTWHAALRPGERAPGDVGEAGRYAARVREIARASTEIRDAA
jgi:homoserine kinase type II